MAMPMEIYYKALELQLANNFLILIKIEELLRSLKPAREMDSSLPSEPKISSQEILDSTLYSVQRFSTTSMG